MKQITYYKVKTAPTIDEFLWTNKKFTINIPEFNCLEEGGYRRSITLNHYDEVKEIDTTNNQLIRFYRYRGANWLTELNVDYNTTVVYGFRDEEYQDPDSHAEIMNIENGLLSRFDLRELKEDGYIWISDEYGGEEYRGFRTIYAYTVENELGVDRLKLIKFEYNPEILAPAYLPRFLKGWYFPLGPQIYCYSNTDKPESLSYSIQTYPYAKANYGYENNEWDSDRELIKRTKYVTQGSNPYKPYYPLIPPFGDPYSDWYMLYPIQYTDFEPKIIGKHANIYWNGNWCDKLWAGGGFAKEAYIKDGTGFKKIWEGL